MIILIMGVTAAGKTTVGRALAEQLHWRFADADDYHSPANVAKMHAGIPLTDEDRAPWLQSLRVATLGWTGTSENVVLACSALKTSYRDILLVSPQVKLVYLRITEELTAARLAARHGHYMNPTLLRRQFETLEEPHDALTIDAAQSTERIVTDIRRAFAI
ncbi:MAG: gluconokinase [Candidatus Korobacteraceae bacterium]